MTDTNDAHTAKLRKHVVEILTECLNEDEDAVVAHMARAVFGPDDKKVIDEFVHRVDYHKAVARYMKWAEQSPGNPITPNENLSEEHDGNWHLNNVNGGIAVVNADGDVIAVGEFWNAYKRLSEEGKCDSPGGAEYRRVLTEWIEDQPDDLDEFIGRRANASPDE